MFWIGFFAGMVFAIAVVLVLLRLWLGPDGFKINF